VAYGTVRCPTTNVNEPERESVPAAQHQDRKQDKKQAHHPKDNGHDGGVGLRSVQNLLTGGRGFSYLLRDEFSFPSPPSPSCARHVGGGALR
ncbi:MAG: hypothetical protein ACRD23_06015, partial [Terriglobales bacterium]